MYGNNIEQKYIETKVTFYSIVTVLLLGEKNDDYFLLILELSTENRTVPQGTEGRGFTDKKGNKNSSYLRK
jgi:hypothetical protein